MRVLFCNVPTLKRLLAIVVLSAPGLAAAQLQLTDAWVRAVPPVSSGTAGYFVLQNNGTEPVTVTGVSASFAHHVMMHSMARNDDGLRQMQHVDDVTVAPGEEIAFVPGGMHLMIMGMDAVPSPGERVEICLQLKGGDQLCHDFEVRREQP
ncbi:MAG: copper chaperone PCu(A)C [Alcanivoracaceae bacterium]|nr:copper chaperone PCu(A)C [Alcanivoracaceae bacterium]